VIRAIRILEVPIYLLVIALFCIENEATIMGIILVIASIARLIANVITDEYVYKK
jgi:hypothetical protein